MTQPIQEPLTTRSIGSLQWGQNQLFRRPDVSAEATSGPYASIVWNDGATVADDTPTTLASLSDFSYGYVSDPLLISTNLGDGRIILDDVEGPGASTLGGVWLAELRIFWVDNFDGDMWTRVNWTMGGSGTFDGISADVNYQKAQGTTINTLTIGEVSSCTSMVIVEDGFAGNNWVTGAFNQVSGVSQDISLVSLTVSRLQEFPTPTGEFTT